jgi:predicted acetyltransferase
MDITLTRAGRADEVLLQNMVQLYTHDFSEYWAGTPRGALSAEGRFGDYPLEEFWWRPGWDALLISVGDERAGFALINDVAKSGEKVDGNIAEFFVLRKHRGGGVGRTVAEMIFDARPGQWELAVARKNLPALAFWRRVAGSEKASRQRELDLDDEHWNGPVLRFAWSA